MDTKVLLWKFTHDSEPHLDSHSRMNYHPSFTTQLMWSLVGITTAIPSSTVCCLPCMLIMRIYHIELSWDSLLPCAFILDCELPEGGRVPVVPSTESATENTLQTYSLNWMVIRSYVSRTGSTTCRPPVSFCFVFFQTSKLLYINMCTETIFGECPRTDQGVRWKPRGNIKH